MRHPIAATILSVLAAGVCACTDRVTAPESVPVRGPVVLSATAANQEWGTGLFVGDGTRYLSCLGEYVHIHNEMPFRWHRVVTPSGNVTFSDPFIPNAGTGQTSGLTSGSVWTLERVVGPEVITTNAGVEAQFVAVLHWASETGPDYTLHNTYHFVQNANGEVTVDNFESRCVLQANGGA